MSARMLALVAALGLGLLIPAAAAGQGGEPRTSLPDLEDEVMCPVCGTTLELAEAPQAEREREQIRRLIAQGLTKEQVKDELVAEYGEEVLAAPASEGFDLAAWVLPGLGMLVAGAMLSAFVARSRHGGRGQPEPAIGKEDARRLREDMSDYEL